MYNPVQLWTLWLAVRVMVLCTGTRAVGRVMRALGNGLSVGTLARSVVWVMRALGNGFSAPIGNRLVGLPQGENKIR